MMKLLVDAGEFMTSLAADLESAQESALAQAMSFEGDRAGRRFANLLIGSGCVDRRLMIDSFSRHVISGCFLHALALARDDDLRNEVSATAATHVALRRGGVRVRFCNPAGRLLRRFPARDHKKVVVVDRRISYIGGINITDHNFAWHDLMLRVEDPDVAAFLADDFEATWRSRPVSAWRSFDGIAIGSASGHDNRRIFEPIFDVIATARERIVVESPYLTFPFIDRLAAARRRGVDIVILAPSPHPHPSFGRYLEWECARSGFELRLLPGMTHVKAMLIDSHRLIIGSSNFDYLSYRVLREYVAIVQDPEVIADFADRIVRMDVSRSSLVRGVKPGLTGRFRRRFMENAGAAIVWLSGAV